MKKSIICLMILFSLNLYSMDIESNKSREKNKKAFQVEGKKYIIRPLFGVATTADLGEIITLRGGERGPYDGKIMGLQVERYVFKQVLDLPINITLQSSFVVHTDNYDSNDPSLKPEDKGYYTEKNSYEINFGIKIYWTQFPWDKYVRTRVGISEGVSYMNRVTNLERYNLYGKNQSNYLNYIDITASFNARDITRIEYLEDTYLGFGVSHRSGIFGNVNGVDGGSNNITVFFETEL